MGHDYIDLKIDTDRHTNGADVAARLRQGEEGGIPWMVILNDKGDALVTSDGPSGNVGCPVKPEERAWFLAMIQKTMQHMTKEHYEAVATGLKTYAEQVLAR
jgi:hypothetical protein